MTRSQGPSQGPSATASTSATGGAGGWDWPPWPQLPDESPRTRQGKFKMFLWAQQDINTALLWQTCGLDPRGLSHRLAGGLESVAGRRAWVSGDPAGLSQRRAGVSRGRRRHLPRTAGLVSRGRRRHLSRTAGSVSRGRRLELPRTAGLMWAAGLGELRTAADIPRDRRAGGLVASGLAAIPPNSHV